MLLGMIGCLAIAAVGAKPVWLCIAVLPLLVSAAMWLGRTRQFVADVSETGLVFADGTAIDFDQIEYTMVQSTQPKTFPLLLVGGSRRVLIPPRLNVASRDLYEFLLTVIPKRIKPPRDPELAAYYQRQQREFGEVLVWHCPGRRNIRWPRPLGRARWICVAIALAGVAYLVYGNNMRQDGMQVAGILLLAFGLISLLITFASSGQPTTNIRNSESASVILCPLGLALAQAEMKGELRWDEVRDVKLHDRAARISVGYESGTRRSGMRRIDLVVDGAIIPIHDVYEEPLGHIHQRIVALWK